MAERNYETPSAPRQPVSIHVTAQKLRGETVIELKLGHSTRLHLSETEARQLTLDIASALGQDP